MRFELQEVYGISELCGGVRCGIEAAIHAVSDLESGSRMGRFDD